MPEADQARPEETVTEARHVTIGLPTHDGARFLSQALDSLLAQDHPSFEIVVSDNASTDATPDILRDYAARDPRIRVERTDELLTAPANFNRVFAAARGPYFMWAADDDRWDPTYVRRCVAALEAAPDAVMACTGLRFIDGEGAIVDADYDRYDNPDLSSASVVERIRRLLRRGGWYEVYGVTRRDALARTRLFQETYGPDVLLVLELAMLGPIVKVPDTLFFYRQLAGRAERERVERQGGVEGLDDLMQARLTHLQESMSRTIATSSLAWPVRQRLRAEILWATYIADTPFGGNARRELGARLAVARRDRDLLGAAKFGALAAIAGLRTIGPRGRQAVGRMRKRIGRWRRDLLRRGA